ncbi:hypothetical protein SAMN05660209_04630 [Geodermatophilus africanus]|uniref:Capsular polysaccharide biosynthesis protein n=1 Tax=Geodermatophilus africanus TaxID=1137993 RepID=A0A1H3Q6F8_9ACTN|nr:hypothetical protein [Geodermatophilus africanus]SDZ08977.1 hypothetical protein SAMN05660209_04630 [Geodermatophilus africanus]
MDLLTIVQMLRRHLTLSMSVIALTVLGGIALLLLTPRQYEATASFVLAYPPAPPTAEQIAENAALGRINYNNPYLRFTNDSTVGQVLSERVGSTPVRQELVDAGAHDGYAIGPSTAFGSSGLVVGVTATGTSAAQTDRTMDLVTQRMQQELADMQGIYGADDEALITALPVAEPSAPMMVLSGIARSLIAVVAIGAIVLFAALSLAERRQSSAARQPQHQGTRRRGQVEGATTAQERPIEAGIGGVATESPSTSRHAPSVKLPTS